MAELAAVLEIPEGTARSRLRRGRDVLGETLAELGSAERADTTMTSIEGWAAEIRERLLGPAKERRVRG